MSNVSQTDRRQFADLFSSLGSQKLRTLSPEPRWLSAAFLLEEELILSLWNKLLLKSHQQLASHQLFSCPCEQLQFLVL